MTAERAVNLIREYAKQTMSNAEFLSEVQWIIARYHHDLQGTAQDRVHQAMEGK